jgi:hypothetical protein
MERELRGQTRPGDEIAGFSPLLCQHLISARAGIGWKTNAKQ